MPTILNHLLRHMRERSRPGESLGVVAKALGTNKAYLSRVETGTIAYPAEKVFLNMLDLYGCEPWKRSVLVELFKKAKGGMVPDESILAVMSWANSLAGFPNDDASKFKRKIIVADLRTLEERQKLIEVETCEAVLLLSMFGGFFRPQLASDFDVGWLFEIVSRARDRVFLADPNPPLQGEGMDLNAMELAENARSGYRCQGSAELIDEMILVENMNLYRYPFVTGQLSRIEKFNERFEALRRTALSPEVAEQVLRAVWKSVSEAREEIGRITGRPYEDDLGG